ncbi:MAG: glycosyltransferase family 1 protein [Gemmatimonadetes bacterium]|nr:glycosyltransferase family 1 protein [Gemmatimonadota bacterium]
MIMSDSENPALGHARFRENLEFLSRNLRFSWHKPTWDLFARLDPAVWRRTQHNPVCLLQELGEAALEERAQDSMLVAVAAELAEALRAYLEGGGTWFERTHAGSDLLVAYFSAEFAVTECLHIFSGGLGVLAGDHLKSASDLGVPLVAVGLLYREGYFEQQVDAAGVQREAYPAMEFERLPLTLEQHANGTPLLVPFPFRDHQGLARVWRADVGRVPLYLLDTDLPARPPEERRITDRLYGGDAEHRLQQEIVLGIGGMRALAALGIAPTTIHLNEGHAAFAGVERVQQATGAEHTALAETAGRFAQDVVFTTHTPVPAGHDFFPAELLKRYLGGYVWEMGAPWERFLALGRHDGTDECESFNMTLLALRLSSRRNGVSRLHGEVSRRMWRGVWDDLEEPEVPIGHITNGVHLATWVAPPMAALYDRHIGREWRDETDQVRWQRAAHVLGHELWAVRSAQRARLIEVARRELTEQLRRRGEPADWACDVLDPDVLTIVYARRFATYKRATLLLSQPERLRRLLTSWDRPVQFIFAGKAHPRDEPGKENLRQIHAWSSDPRVRRHFVFLEGYDVELARSLVSGADVWLNVPRRPYEASGTSGMKAAANGALNLSIPDGWWAEAWAEHNHLAEPPGWSIEAPQHWAEGQDEEDANALFELLEHDVIPLFYERDLRAIPNRWCERMRATMRELVPFFNTHRMVQQYTEAFYLRAGGMPGRTHAHGASEEVAAAG